MEDGSLSGVFNGDEFRIQSNAQFETDILFQINDKFPFDSSIFKQYLCDDKKNEPPVEFAKNSLLLGEIKSFFNFPLAYNQHSRLLFLSEFENFKGVINGFLIFQSNQSEYLQCQKDKVLQLEKEFQCKIFVLFVKSDFLFLSIYDLTEKNYNEPFIKILRKLNTCSNEKANLLKLLDVYFKKFNCSEIFKVQEFGKYYFSF